MKRFLIFLLSCALGVSACAGTPDTTALFSRLDDYLKALDGADLSTACDEADFIISSVGDSTLRNEVGARVYRHFRDSGYMGSENVAVYVYDKWFAECTLLFEDPEEFDEASFFALSNRSSLLLSKAPRLTLPDLDGKDCTLPSAKGRASVIYFYSARCPKCLFISRSLGRILKGHRLEVYAVYMGDDDKEWMEYAANELKIKGCGLKVHHLKGDPSTCTIAYGVLQTPRLFLVDGRGTIIGRKLDSAALELLLKTVNR